MPAAKFFEGLVEVESKARKTDEGLSRLSSALAFDYWVEKPGFAQQASKPRMEGERMQSSYHFRGVEKWNGGNHRFSTVSGIIFFGTIVFTRTMNTGRRSGVATREHRWCTQLPYFSAMGRENGQSCFGSPS
jgi:hypothetical protein